MLVIHIASDHAGFKLKQALINNLGNTYNINDCGCYSIDNVDYPDYAHSLAQIIAKNPKNFGVLICNTGIGMSIAANRHPEIRAALCHNLETAKFARQHNNANILCMGALFVDQKTATEMLGTFIHATFENGRHAIRVTKLRPSL